MRHNVGFFHPETHIHLHHNVFLFFFVFFYHDRTLASLVNSNNLHHNVFGLHINGVPPIQVQGPVIE